ncbi:ABC transporter substrate-binding protein [Actinomycetes bacterium KLBMP 9759]
MAVAGRVPRFRFGVVPHPRRFPAYWTDWWRVAAILLAVAVVAGTFVVGPRIAPSILCNDGGLPSGDLWKSGDDCVGITEGPYFFGLERFAPVMRTIDEQNRSAAEKCDPQATPATVGILLTLTDDFAGSRGLHELEGMAAAQRTANGAGCVHPIKLVIGHVGTYADGGSAAVEVARRLVTRADVVAVAGIGLSHQASADVADELAAAKLPMVSDLITAEGFDQSGSAADQPSFGGCDPDITYPRGIGKDFFYRVAFRSAAQLARLDAALQNGPDFLLVPTGGSDPYTCTTLPLIQRQFGGDISEVKFDTEDATTVAQTARRVCEAPKDVTVAYIARGRDLGQFIFSLDEAISNGRCSATSITVMSTSDGNRIRTGEADPRLEEIRVRALRSPAFQTGKVMLLATLVGGADKQEPYNPGFAAFEASFAAAGFDAAHIDDGWALNAYDALTAISTALRMLPAGREIQRGQVNTELSGLTSVERSAPGAGGPITFDNSGNRTGDGPPVVRLCPARSRAAGASAATTSVIVPPGAQALPPCP